MAGYEVIREKLPREELLGQLAEECCELGQAAMKLRRALDGANPTPVTVAEAEARVLEEAADVLLCLELAGDYPGEYIASPEILRGMWEKLERWGKRLEGKK